jgi:hypothetical protein
VTGKKRRGAPLGNQNARTHGFYARSASPEEQEALKDASSVEGLDQEIALLRLRISAAARDPRHYHMIIPGMSLLARLLQARYRMGYGKQARLESAIRTVIRDVLLPLGIAPSGIPEGSPAQNNPDQIPSESGRRLFTKNNPAST